ncbi:hypothetical protein RhiirA5_418097 [Rhizophagus irregularis]|uniref:Uncharacterized protein n=1 Tax=Rhizophagus irregularis TaxID=588596 RepID=A0A2I1EU18_9GLOM|nr:hypothetical protein RhiirA5_418097 [Rhizophagus irregularis]PKC70530.1 hypothetical protein RhiirA1_454666 [Rhizophagus irregularis]PKY25592.1 hypothetical protein RhiirB3_440606 [Rhizophagus irregularis]CAB4464359.1 unnamed protein product [Rhizophagus irregularis]CAB5096325.1 unnamed protein product [Rhizophagus irregularis]
MNHKIELQKLHSDDELFYRIKIFVNDLLTFSDSEDARSRLEKDPMAKFFFSNEYFSEKDINYLLDFPTASGLSVSELLSVELSNKHKVCSSHELAPLLQEIFGIQKSFQKEKDFKGSLKKFEKNWKKSKKHIGN